jgi:hypothetical protein
MWPLRSPDYVKSSTYRCTDQVGNLDELTQQITTAVETVIPEMSRQVWAEINHWLNICCATKDRTL